MATYLLKRILLIIPTLFGIMLISFAVIQFAPGGPVEQIIAQVTGTDVAATSRFGGGGGAETGGASQGSAQSGGDASAAASKYRGAQGLDPEFIRQLEKQFGFDKPMHERFILMMGNFIRFDFGTSYFRDETVVNLVLEKMPVSISLGLWSTLILYVVAIPLGVRKAVRDGTRFDLWTTIVMTIAFATPSFVLAVLLIVFFAGGSFLDWFPLRGLVSENFAQLSLLGQIGDYFWHLALPLVSLIAGGFLSLTMLTKNSYLDQINMQYVLTARAKGLTERRVLYGHVFRNAMLIVIASFPGVFVGILFTGALLIEVIFSLDGLGLLGFEALIKRDYPIVFASTYFFTLLGLAMRLVGDLTYTIVDPRIDFEARGA